MVKWVCDARAVFNGHGALPMRRRGEYSLSESFDTQALAQLVLAHVDANPDSLRFTPIRTGKHNTSYWVDSDRGRLVLRIAPPDDAGFLFYERLMMRQEPGLHQLIRARTTIPVAEVIGHDFRRALIDRDYLITLAPALRLVQCSIL
jgi:aminoglycoside phosphotransferase (APT) family kinase protein